MATVTATYVREHEDGTAFRSACSYNTISRQISNIAESDETESELTRECIVLGTGEVIDLFDVNADAE